MLKFMELLLSSNGLTNKSLIESFAAMFAAGPHETTLTYIPTAGLVDGGEKAWQTSHKQQLRQLGYRVQEVDLQSVHGTELEDVLVTSDGLYVDGGNVFFLSYWMQRSGFFDLLADQSDVQLNLRYFGVSAGSMIATPSLLLASQALEYPQDFAVQNHEQFAPEGKAAAQTLQLVDFLFRPHLHNLDFPLARLELIEQVSERRLYPTYVLDDQSAVHVRDGEARVISEGEWHLLPSKVA